MNRESPTDQFNRHLNSIKFKKAVQSEIELFNALFETHQVKIDILMPGVSESIGNLVKLESKGFVIETEVFPIPDNLAEKTGDFRFLTAKKEWKPIARHWQGFEVNSAGLRTSSIRMYSFMTVGFQLEESKYFRVVIPQVKNKILHFFHIEDSVFKTENHSTRGLLIVKLGQLSFHLFQVKDKQSQKSYLFVDSCQPMKYNEFMEASFSILLSYGYVTGYFIQNEGLFFSSDNADDFSQGEMFYQEFRNSIFSSYSPVQSNAGVWAAIVRDGNTQPETLRNLSMGEFSNLCMSVNESEEMRAILLLILEASTCSLVLMPSAYFVALESLCKILKKPGISNSPIRPVSIDVINSLVKQWQKDIESRTDILDDGKTFLKKKIGSLHNPPNADELESIFKHWTIELYEKDKEILKDRNVFLHGKITFKTESDDANKSHQKALDTALRLYTLLSMLIMKSTGYDNKVPNYVKIFGSTFTNDENESWYRQV